MAGTGHRRWPPMTPEHRWPGWRTGSGCCWTQQGELDAAGPALRAQPGHLARLGRPGPAGRELNSLGITHRSPGPPGHRAVRAGGKHRHLPRDRQRHPARRGPDQPGPGGKRRGQPRPRHAGAAGGAHARPQARGHVGSGHSTSNRWRWSASAPGRIAEGPRPAVRPRSTTWPAPATPRSWSTSWSCPPASPRSLATALRAARLAGAAEAIRQKAGMPISQADAAVLERFLAPARATIARAGLGRRAGRRPRAHPGAGGHAPAVTVTWLSTRHTPVTPQATRHVFLAEPASNDGVVNWFSWRCLRETSRYGRRPAPAAQQKAAQATPLPARSRCGTQRQGARTG